MANLELDGGIKIYLREIGKTPLLGICVALKPIEHLFTVGRNDVCLREVNMSIDKARHDQTATVVGNREAGRKCWQECQGITELMDPPVIEHQQSVLEVLVGAIAELIGIAEEMQNGRAKNLQAGIHGIHGAMGNVGHEA